MFLALSDLCFKSCSAPLLKSDLLPRVAKSMFISSVNYRAFWRPLSPAGPVAMGLRKLSPPPCPSTPSPHCSNPPSTPLQIAREYVPGCPVNFLSRVHRYTDIGGINLLLRIVMPMQMYTRFLSVIIFLLWVWVLVHTGNIPLCLCGQHRQGQD